MKIYLAARYDRINEMQRYAQSLEYRGHEITSHWVNAGYLQIDEDVSVDKESYAKANVEDIIRSNTFIYFTEPHNATEQATVVRGGRHVEYGIALSMKMFDLGVLQDIVIIGHRENTFTWLHNYVQFYETFDTYLESLPINSDTYTIESLGSQVNIYCNNESTLYWSKRDSDDVRHTITCLHGHDMWVVDSNLTAVRTLAMILSKMSAIRQRYGCHCGDGIYDYVADQLFMQGRIG